MNVKVGDVVMVARGPHTGRSGVVIEIPSTEHPLIFVVDAPSVPDPFEVFEDEILKENA